MEKFDRSLLPDEPDLSFEISFWNAGIKYIAGIDEAGRGPLAGPVAAAALVLPPRPEVAAVLAGVRDSKQMTALPAGVQRRTHPAGGIGLGDRICLRHGNRYTGYPACHPAGSSSGRSRRFQFIPIIFYLTVCSCRSFLCLKLPWSRVTAAP